MLQENRFTEAAYGYMRERVKEYSAQLHSSVTVINNQTGLAARMVCGDMGELCPDLSLVWEGMQEDKFVLKPPISELEESYREGQAIVLVAPVAGKEIGVGYIRRSNLLDDKTKLRLGLSERVGVNIQEIGSSFLVKEYRKTAIIDGEKISYYELMRRLSMAEALPDIVSGKLLIIGTSKNKRMVEINERMNEEPIFKEFGVGLFNTVHTSATTDLIAPFTCVCSPDFGYGFQLTRYCPKRITGEQLDNLDNLAKESPDREIPCVMYVSSSALAAYTNQQLRAVYSNEGRYGEIDSQGNLVNALRVLSYYPK
ncbi:MAG: hypothetical protein AAB583_01125 [Patescibacteria group bacterium]